MTELTFQCFVRLDPGEPELRFGAAMNAAGYFAFYRFAEDFRGGLRGCADGDFALYRTALRRAASLFPLPGKFSPAFQSLWEEFAVILDAKEACCAAVPEDARGGEWQVLIDNPYVHRQVVCYPGLAFAEAAYMYGYFRRELQPHEILRLQRVTDALTISGDRQRSTMPD